VEKKGTWTVVLALGFASGLASAQLVTSITKPVFGENDPDVFLTDVVSGQSTFLFNPEPTVPATAPGFGGLAADEAGRRLFASTRNGPQDDLYTIDYGTLTATRVGQINVGGSAISVDGLAWDSLNSQLWATKRLGTGGQAEGLYRVDATTGAAELVLQYETGTFNFDISAIDYDATTGLLYLVDEDADAGAGIWSYDTNAGGGLSFVADLAAGVTDVDGLGAGDGKLYLVSDGLEGNGGMHAVYNLLTGEYEDGIMTPYPGYTPNNIFGLINPSAGGAYAPGLIPTPGAAVAVGLAGLIAGRRRR
jgi:hypothetical protein